MIMEVENPWKRAPKLVFEAPGFGAFGFGLLALVGGSCFVRRFVWISSGGAGPRSASNRFSFLCGASSCRQWLVGRLFQGFLSSTQGQPKLVEIERRACDGRRRRRRVVGQRQAAGGWLFWCLRSKGGELGESVLLQLLHHITADSARLVVNDQWTRKTTTKRRTATRNPLLVIALYAACLHLDDCANTPPRSPLSIKHMLQTHAPHAVPPSRSQLEHEQILGILNMIFNNLCLSAITDVDHC